MRRAASEPLYVSRNHLEGSLCDAPIDRVLAACRKHLVTGVVRVHVKGTDGVLELRAGAIDRAHLGDLSGDRVLDALRATRDGWYEVAQRLPDLTGELGDAALMQGDIEGVPLIALMRHCEDNALTCTITVISGFDRACIEYRAGEIARVELNGFFDDDALPQVVRWPDARYRVAAPPLDLDIEGWPVARREPTVPFQIGPPLAEAPVMRSQAPVSIASPGEERRARLYGTSLAALGSGGEIITAEGTPLPGPPPTPPPIPAVATRYPTGDTVQTRRARRRSPARSQAGADLAWIALAAILLLALGVASLVVFAA